MFAGPSHEPTCAWRGQTVQHRVARHSRTLYTIRCRFMLLWPSNMSDTTSMLTCCPLPYASVTSTLSASSAVLIFSCDTGQGCMVSLLLHARYAHGAQPPRLDCYTKKSRAARTRMSAISCADIRWVSASTESGRSSNDGCGPETCAENTQLCELVSRAPSQADTLRRPAR